MAIAKKPTKQEREKFEALGVNEGELVPMYKVVCGCNAADGTRYEIGADYNPMNHDPQTTLALIEMNCLEEVE
jgi:hypothetical protein